MYDFKRFSTDGYEFQETLYRESWGDYFRVLGPDGEGPFLGMVAPALPVYAEERIRRLFGQVEAYRGLRHPRLLSVHHGGRIFWPADRSQRYYLVTDFYEEGDLLAYRLESGAIGRRISLQLVADAATALHVLAESGRSHGAVTLHALVVDQDQRGRLTSPMEGRLRAELDAVNSIGGSNWDFTFVAPEVIDGRDKGDIRSDLFSLTAILYFLLTGTKPFSSNTAFGLAPELLKDVLPERPELPAGVKPLPDGLELVLACGLHLDPADRYQSPRSFLEDIRDVLQGAPPAHATRVMAGRPRWAGDTAPAGRSPSEPLTVETAVDEEPVPSQTGTARVRRSVTRVPGETPRARPRAVTDSGGNRARRRSRDGGGRQSGEGRRRTSSDRMARRRSSATGPAIDPPPASAGPPVLLLVIGVAFFALVVAFGLYRLLR